MNEYIRNFDEPAQPWPGRVRLSRLCCRQVAV